MLRMLVSGRAGVGGWWIGGAGRQTAPVASMERGIRGGNSTRLLSFLDVLPFLRMPSCTPPYLPRVLSNHSRPHLDGSLRSRGSVDLQVQPRGLREANVGGHREQLVRVARNKLGMRALRVPEHTVAGLELASRGDGRVGRDAAGELGAEDEGHRGLVWCERRTEARSAGVRARVVTLRLGGGRG